LSFDNSAIAGDSGGLEHRWCRCLLMTISRFSAGLLFYLYYLACYLGLDRHRWSRTSCAQPTAPMTWLTIMKSQRPPIWPMEEPPKLGFFENSAIWSSTALEV